MTYTPPEENQVDFELSEYTAPVINEVNFELEDLIVDKEDNITLSETILFATQAPQIQILQEDDDINLTEDFNTKLILQKQFIDNVTLTEDFSIKYNLANKAFTDNVSLTEDINFTVHSALNEKDFSDNVLLSENISITRFSDMKGSGTAGDPYQVETWDHLTEVHWHLDAHYILMNDLDETTPGYKQYISETSDGKGFTPIGDYTNLFTGSFDGQGYYIADLYINRPTEVSVGLFGEIGDNVIIKNLGLLNVDITGGTYVGGLVGNNRGSFGNTTTITECFTTGDIEGEYFVGGLIGYCYYGHVSNCYSQCNVTSTSDNVGGFMGVHRNSQTTDCYSAGAVTGVSNVGGFIGDYIGGGFVVNSFWDIETSGQSTSAAGIGRITNLMKSKIVYDVAGWDIEDKDDWTNETWYIEDILQFTNPTYEVPIDYPKLGVFVQDIPEKNYSNFTIDETQYYDDIETLSVKKELSDLNSSSRFTVDIHNDGGKNSNNFWWNDEVIIKADIQRNPPITKIFRGIIENIYYSGKENKERITLSGRDYSLRLMDRTVEPEVYNNQYAGDIIKDIVNKYVDDITTENVENGVLIERIAFNHIPVFDAIEQLAKLSGFFFYVDIDKDLHFKEKSTVSSGRTFNDTNILSTSFKTRRNSIFNEVWVYGDRYLDGYNEEFVASGGSEFTLLYKPTNTAVTSSGVTIQPGGIDGMTQEVGSSVKYLVNYNDKKIIFVSGTTQGDNVPASGVDVVIDYMRDLPIVKVGENDDSVGRYGKRVKVIQDKNIKDPITAETIMLRELDEYSDPLKEGTLTLKGVENVMPGLTCRVDIPFYNINNYEYDIISANYNFNKSSEQKGDAMYVRINKKIPDVTDKLKEIMNQLKKIQGADMTDADLLTRYKIAGGSFMLASSGIQVYERDVGSSFILGCPMNGLLGSYSTHTLGDWTGSWEVVWSGGYTDVSTGSYIWEPLVNVRVNIGGTVV